MEKALVLTILFFACAEVTYSQEDSATGTCSNAVIVLTKDEMKREIKAQITEACTMEKNQQQTCSNSSSTENIEASVIQKLDEISTKLEATMNKLISLHQPGKTASHPATSCAELYDYNPSSPSGYYWLKDSSNAAIQVFCDMTLTCKGVGGGWMQVIKLNMTNSSHQCPTGTRLRTDLPKRLCGINFTGRGCSSTIFDVHGIEYTQVCGKIIAYQDASTDAFGVHHYYPARANANLNGNYVDGISLTHGKNPRKHIWTFAAALDEATTYPAFNCPCTDVHHAASATRPPAFVGNDYFCDTGSTHTWSYTFYPDDPLWDGAGCGPANTCCTLNSPPWFRKQLPSSTTDNIEMRMCRDQNAITNNRPDEETPIEILEIYIH